MSSLKFSRDGPAPIAVALVKCDAHSQLRQSTFDIDLDLEKSDDSVQSTNAPLQTPPAPLTNRHLAMLSSSTGDYEVALEAQETRKRPFRLDPEFVASYAQIPPPFGYNGLGGMVFLSHYSRLRPDGRLERWHETCERVTNGTYNMQKKWVESQDIGWKPAKAQRSAQEFYDRMFNLKFSPPGRGLWAMGTPITETAHAYAALNNCAFISTALCGIDGHEPERPFYVGMDMLMFGIGVGFDTRGADNNVMVYAPLVDEDDAQARCGNRLAYREEHVLIADSREGWVESVKLLLQTYFHPNLSVIQFDYSLIRPAGMPLKTFGGTSGGPQPLMDLHAQIRTTLDRRASGYLSVTDITDLFNQIGCCVVAGNIRRSAEIAFGKNGDEEFMNLKNYKMNPEREAFGWASNNTVFCRVGDNYNRVAELLSTKGEPGVCWLENMQQYSRMGCEPTKKDMAAMGGNPCLEQTLESYELCCLVETFPHRHFVEGVSEEAALEDYLRTLKFAYLFGKTVTLGKTPWVETNRVMLRNRRIGCGITGVAQFLAHVGENWNTLKQWLREGYKRVQYYDEVYSKWLAIPRSIKTTTVKPSGTVSLLAGSTPGLHYPESRFYIRRKTLSTNNPRDVTLAEYITKKGYTVEPSVYNNTSLIAEIPIDAGKGVRPQAQVTMWEQLSLAAFMQEHWSDNQVSATVTFDDNEAKDIARALQVFQFKLKGVSFLKKDCSAYAQKPYEAITEERYRELMSTRKPLDFDELYNAVVTESAARAGTAGAYRDTAADRYCDGDQCVL